MSADIKRSVRIAGHRTSIALEEEFWAALKEIAQAEALSLNALIGRIDAERLPQTQNLSRAIRLFVLGYYRDRTRP
jgi:predicted DNA-binding ribbon-helix-helix protein